VTENFLGEFWGMVVCKCAFRCGCVQELHCHYKIELCCMVGKSVGLNRVYISFALCLCLSSSLLVSESRNVTGWPDNLTQGGSCTYTT
jgi:hypothetical protein